MISSMPASTASSTIYWIVGLSRIGNISLDIALMAGKNLVPRPAAGIIAFLIFIIYILPLMFQITDKNSHTFINDLKTIINKKPLNNELVKNLTSFNIIKFDYKNIEVFNIFYIIVLIV